MDPAGTPDHAEAEHAEADAQLCHRLLNELGPGVGAQAAESRVQDLGSHFFFVFPLLVLLLFFFCCLFEGGWGVCVCVCVSGAFGGCGVGLSLMGVV